MPHPAPEPLKALFVHAAEGLTDARPLIGLETSDDRPPARPRLHPDWPLFEVLAPLLEALVATSGSEPVERRWGKLREMAEHVLQGEDGALKSDGRTDLRLALLTLLVALDAAKLVPCTVGSMVEDAETNSKFAGRLSERGNAHANKGDITAAIADYDAAVQIREAMRDAAIAANGEDAWSLSYRNDLATVLQRRGNAHSDRGDLAAAIADYDTADEIGLGIFSATCDIGGMAAWLVPYGQDYAEFLTNYARSLFCRGTSGVNYADVALASAHCERAVRIGERIRDYLLETGGDVAWSMAYRNNFAVALASRGYTRVVGDGDFAAAFADYDAAVQIGEGIRDGLRATGGEAAWSIAYRNDLAMVLQNRGLAHLHNADLAAATADFDAAVQIREWIRDRLRTAGGEAAWSTPYRNDLAMVLQVRGLARFGQGDLGAAIADYDAAVQIHEWIRDGLLGAGGEAAWSIPYRNALAAVLQNRGLAHAGNGALAAAIADFNAAVQIGEWIRDRLREAGGEGAWSVPLRVDLARIYANRAGALGRAKGSADLAAATDIAEGLRALGQDREARK